MGNTRTLQPFTPGDPRAVAAGKKGAEVRRQKREASQLVTVKQASDGAELLDRLTTAYQRDNLAASAAAAAQHMIALFVSGAIIVKDATDAANLLKALHDMARLEEGQSTSNILHGTIDAGAIIGRIEALRGELLPSTDVDA